MAVATDPTLEEIKQIAQGTRRSSSSSPSSSTCTAGRARSSCPAANLDDLVADGAGFAGFAAGEIGQVPSDPDIAAMPDLDSFTPVPWQPNLARFACDVTVEGEPWPYCPRTILRSVVARAKELGYEFKIGIELEYFLVRAPRRRLDRDRRRARHAREALLRHGGPDAPVRLPDHRLEVLQRARLGELRERPRGRERPVRAELRRTTTRSSSCDRAIFFRYMVHTLAEQHGMIATFMPKPFTQPDRQRLPLPHVALARRREPVPRRGRPARPRPLGAPPTTSSAA